MTANELKQKMAAAVKLAKQGLVSLYEVEQMINRYIEQAFPWYGSDDCETWHEKEKLRRLAHRRKWRMLLDLSMYFERHS